MVIHVFCLSFLLACVHIFDCFSMVTLYFNFLSGFCAAYCTYNVMDLDTSKVLGVWVAHKDMVKKIRLTSSSVYSKYFTQVKCSSDMEPYAAKALLLNLIWVHGLVIDSITTDRSLSIKAMLE